MLSREPNHRPRGGARAAAIVTIGLTTGFGTVSLSGAPGARAADGPVPTPAVSSGKATHYAPTPQGNCSYPSPPSNGLYAALPSSEWDNGAACGEYLDITGPNGHKVRAEVVDQCPQCEDGHVDLSQGAFSKLAPLPAGEIPVSYHTAANPPLPAPLAVRLKEGSSANWLALLPMNTGNPLSSVQVKNSSGGWDTLTEDGYGYWIAQQGEGPGPFTVKLTDTQGHTATLNGITLTPGQVQNTHTWMYGHRTAPGLPGLLPGLLGGGH